MRGLVAFVICTALAAPATASLPGDLLSTASRRSGFPARHPVRTSTVSAVQYRSLLSHARARTYPSNLQRVDAAAYVRFGLSTSGRRVSHTRAWYDVSTRRLVLQRYPKADRRAIIHELTRALIDQNY